jgi:hypothetical protein
MVTTNVMELGRLFAHHLRSRNSAATRELAGALSSQDPVRASLLQGFAESGSGIVPAGWWHEGAVCHVSLEPPEPTELQQLWFDPLEVTAAVVTTGTGHCESHPEFSVWVSLQPVEEWQLHGANLVTDAVPGRASNVSGSWAQHYAELFGKSTVQSVDWQSLRDDYGDQLAGRVWGSAAKQFGGGGSISGFVEVVQRDETGAFVTVDAEENEPLGLAFRTMVFVDDGLSRDESALDRCWTN